MKSIIKCPYYYFEKALPAEMCDTIIALGQQKIQEDATLNSTRDTDEEMRRGQVAWIRDEWLQQMIASYVARANSEANWNFVINNREDIQFATYNEDVKAFYDWHRDCDIEQEKYRKLSVSVQLSDYKDYSGGHLLLKNMWGSFDLPMDSGVYEKGTIIVFPSLILHTVTPMTKGTRHSLVQWFSGPDFV